MKLTRKQLQNGLICTLCIAMFSLWFVTSGMDRQVSEGDPQVHIDINTKGNWTENQIEKVRLLCWTATMRRNLVNKTIYVKKTWGKRCDVLLFFGSEEIEDFPVIGVSVPEGRNHLTEKTYAAFRHIYTHYRDKADWFLKADDDTYVIVDNLKYFLSSLNKSEPLYFGYKFFMGFNSGGAGYVLSKEALIRFGEKGEDEKVCPNNTGAEDMEMGYCMDHLGVKNINTLDDMNRTRFHASNPWEHINANKIWILKTLSSYGLKTGAKNISNYPFTFHYVGGPEMVTMELLLYHIKHISRKGTVLD